MATTTIASAAAEETSRQLPQYSRRQICALWLAVTAPMSVLGWLVPPWAAQYLHTRDPFIDSLVVCFDIGLLWMIALVLVVVRREQGTLRWARVRDALWLRAPRDPSTGRGWRRVWIWVLGFVVLSALVNMLPLDPTGPLPRDLPNAILTERVQHYFAGNWVGFGLMVVNAFASPIAEELVFRGLLLPRTKAAFGKANVVANGALFTLYHLHQPWSMPNTFIDGTINQAFASSRFRSTWMGLVTHTAPSFLVCGVLLGQVLA